MLLNLPIIISSEIEREKYSPQLMYVIRDLYLIPMIAGKIIQVK